MSLSSLINTPQGSSRAASKTLKLKKQIVAVLLGHGSLTIADLSQRLEYSIPTVTNVVNELLAEETIFDLGKIDTLGGRRPNIYGINAESAFFLGVEVNRCSLSMGLQNLHCEFVNIEEKIPFVLNNTKESLDSLCNQINRFIVDSGVCKSHILGACVNLSGRINSQDGFSYNYFFFEEASLSSLIESKIGLATYLENDSRAMCFGEYNCGVVEKEQNVIFVNMSWGVGIGIMCNGDLYYGKSGYSGEFGHSPLFNNDILCQCGKKGCLETEVSGWAFERIFRERLNKGMSSLISTKDAQEEINLETLIRGVIEDEDVLAIDIVSHFGELMGRYISMLINIFNPDLVVIGGSFSALGDYLLYPMQSAIKKYSLNLVSQDMELKVSALGSRAGIIGACCIVRAKFMAQL